MLSTGFMVIVCVIIFCSLGYLYSDDSNIYHDYKSQKTHADMFLTAKEFITLNHLAPDICRYQDSVFGHPFFYYKKEDGHRVNIGIVSFHDYLKVVKYIKQKEKRNDILEKNEMKMGLIKQIRKSLSEESKELANSVKNTIDPELKL